MSGGSVVCAKKTCPAYAVFDVCPVHTPDKVIDRALAIVTRRFDQVIVTHEAGSPSDEELKQLRTAILHDLESTI